MSFWIGGGTIKRFFITSLFLLSMVAAGLAASHDAEDGRTCVSVKPVKVDAAKHTYKKKRVHTKAYYRKKVYKRKHVRAYRRTSRDVGASYHRVTSQYVESVARCSCSLHTDYAEHRAAFRNHCPFCGRDGTLRYEEGPTCPEGMWVCSHCDADFCLVHGKAHTARARYLIRY